MNKAYFVYKIPKCSYISSAIVRSPSLLCQLTTAKSSQNNSTWPIYLRDNSPQATSARTGWMSRWTECRAMASSFPFSYTHPLLPLQVILHCHSVVAALSGVGGEETMEAGRIPFSDLLLLLLPLLLLTCPPAHFSLQLPVAGCPMKNWTGWVVLWQLGGCELPEVIWWWRTGCALSHSAMKRRADDHNGMKKPASKLPFQLSLSRNWCQETKGCCFFYLNAKTNSRMKFRV